MNKKGFTLVELLAVFILLGVIVAIAFKVTDDIKEQSKLDLLKTSAKSLFTAADNYYADNDYKNFPSSGVSISDLDIQSTTFIDGRVKLDKNGKFILAGVTDGTYCINGSIDDLSIEQTECSGGLPLEGAVKAYVLVQDTETWEPIPISDFPNEYDTSNILQGAVMYVDSEGHFVDYSNQSFISRETNIENVNTFKQMISDLMTNSGLNIEIHSYIDEELGFSYVFGSACDLYDSDSSSMPAEEYEDYCTSNHTLSELSGGMSDAQLIEMGFIIIEF